jgi:transcription antitermination protein NusB
MTTPGPRRRAREAALQILHLIDAGGDPPVPPDTAIARYFAHLSPEGGPAVEDEDEAGPNTTAGAKLDRELVESLVRGVCEHRDEIDGRLAALSRNWRLERMAVVERNVIRMALFELAYAKSAPVNVVLNEAVELAKRYGTAEGAAFANGLLDRAVDELGLR